MRPGRVALLLVTSLLLVGACTGGPGGSSAPSPSTPASGGPGTPAPSPSSAGLIFRAAYEGGFIAPSGSRARLPLVSVFGDGRIMTEGAVPAIYPGPLVAPIIVRSVGVAGALAILKAAEDAGLSGAGITDGGPPVADAPTTVITVVRDGVPTVSRFAALGIGPGQPSASQQVRAAVEALLARLTGTDTFGGPTTPDGVYRPLGYKLFVTPGAPELTDPSLARPPVAWPLAGSLGAIGTADPLGGDGARVGAVVGADAATIGPILAAATHVTPFTSGGKEWTIVVRPLFPDEAAAVGG